MCFKVVISLLTILSVSGQISANYFCELTCNQKTNTVCLREDKSCSASDGCGKKFKMLPFKDSDRDLVVDLHNKLRNNLALGNDTRGGNGVVANMKTLSYDKELEFVAQCYANACKEQGNHDKCRRTSRFANVGQNMYGLEASDNVNFTKPKWIEDAVNGWYDEIVDTTPEIIDKFAKSSKVIGHFTQVVWADATHVGCGRTLYGNGKNTYMSIYCNYGIGGNILGRPVYVRGKPCSECGSLKCNDKFEGLCGQVESLRDDHWTPPFGIDILGKDKQDSGKSSRLDIPTLMCISVFALSSYVYSLIYSL